MHTILVSGLINIETTLRVDGFPIDYFPVRYPFFGVNSSISGVGFNVAKALTTLGDSVRFLSLIGQDPGGKMVIDALQQASIPPGFVLNRLEQTPQSVILYAPGGRRQIHVDLKDIQERSYPLEGFQAALPGCSLVVLCNINFSRPFLHLARQSGKLVATDVHAIDSLDDEYNRDFMAGADILFMSDERLPLAPEDWIREIWHRYQAPIVIVGLGARGTLLGVRSERQLVHFPATTTRPIINTIGAGDALFSAFLHCYLQSGDPYEAIHKASLFASYKIGERGAADGFLNEQGLNQLYQRFAEESLFSPPNFL